MSKTDTVVSVIVPVFNTEKYLKRCIDSIINQTHKNLQIILINDGSTDNSKLICEWFEKKYNFITLINQKNKGPSSARNAGLEISTGSFISFIDSDDFIEPTFIEELLVPIYFYNDRVSVCGRNVVSDNDTNEMFVISESKCWTSFEALSKLLDRNDFDGSVCDKLFPIEYFKELRFKNGLISEDIPVVVEVLTKCQKLCHVGHALYNYYIRVGSRTNSPYNPRKITILKSSLIVKDLLINHYPELKYRAQHHYYESVIHIICLNDLWLYPRHANLILRIAISEYKNIIFGSFSLKKKSRFTYRILKVAYYLITKND